MRKAGLGLLCLAFAVQAKAEDPASQNLSRATAGYNYYNRPGSDLSSHDRDLSACAVYAAGLQSVDQQLGAGASYGLLGALIGGALADAANNGVMAASIENCMVAYGWRVVVLPDAQGSALAMLAPAALRKRLSDWIASTVPEGEVKRVWKNEALDGSINHFSLRPPSPKGRQLSVAVAAVSNPPASSRPPFTERKPNVKITIDPKWPKKPLQPAEFSRAPVGSAILIINVKGMSLRNGNGFLITRDGPDLVTTAAAIDHATDGFVAARGALGNGGDSKFLALAVPPGRWRFTASISGLMQLNYCLGSPSFEVKPSEVIFLGTFDLGASRMGPDTVMVEV